MATPGRTTFGPPGVRWWFAAVLLLGVTVIALLAWIAMAPERMPSHTGPATTTSTAPSSAPATMPATAAIPTPAAPVSAPTASAPLVPLVATDPSRTVPFESALSPGESQVASQAINSATSAAATPAVPAAPVRNSATRTSQRTNAEAGGSGRADPRVGCEQMFFAFAARCEANHCAQAAYSRHPRCAIVRQERLRDEARRNLTSGY